MMIRSYTFLLTWLALFSQASAQMVPLVPEPVPQREFLLLQDALQVEPEILAGGYRQYDLTVARFMTWHDGPKDIMVRLLLPPPEPAETENGYPLVAYVHGGGYIGGSPLLDVTEQRNGFGAALSVLLNNGFAVASLGYRLAREAGWPVQVTDLKSGLRFLALHGHHWGIEGSIIGLAGHSAGARLAVLLGAMDQDMFTDQHNPWLEGRYSIGGVWMWAGSAWDWPSVDQWVEFGKPTRYSVPRLLFGEHPALDDATRHRFRVRATIPHLSMALPPLFKLRGASDYRGDHDDALKTIEVWRALGADATLAIVPGGHNTIGPTDSLLHFFTRYVKDTRPSIHQDRNPARTAEILNDLEEYKAAIEVLVQANTQDHGFTIPSGHWLILHDQSLLWNPDGQGWTEGERAELTRAKQELARLEAAFAREEAGQTDWFRIAEAAGNAMKLGLDDPETETLRDQAEMILAEENEVFQRMQKANEHWHQGEKEEALGLLRDHPDSRITHACKRINKTQTPAMPEWADQWGVDIYGQWASISLGHGVWMRFRHVPPGIRTLPNDLQYRNTASDPWVTKIAIDQGFWLAETETTVAQWHAFMTDRPDQVRKENSDHPVAMIDYLQITDWLKVVNKNYPDITFRLPTEEEWLFSAYSPDHKHPSAMFAAVHALSSDNKSPQALSVYHTAPDMNGYYGLLGGVMEWTASPGHSLAHVTDEDGNRITIAYPIARGGAWSNMPHSLDLGHRMQHRHGNRQPDLGFRVVVSSAQDPLWDDTSRSEWPAVFQEVGIPSSADGKTQMAYFYPTRSETPKPLVVSLHTWSNNYQQRDPLIGQILENDYNYIRPDFRGPNNTSEACGSPLVVSDIDDAISYAIEHGHVDPDQVHVIGVSGGGHATLIAYMQSAHQIRSFAAWVPITDLVRWYEESIGRNNRYAGHIALATTGHDDRVDLQEARRRSPLYMDAPTDLRHNSKLYLYAGIHDGYTGSVPITHSLHMYNKVVSDFDPSASEDLIPEHIIQRLVVSRYYPTKEEKEIDGRVVHYHRQYADKVELTIFEGGHEMLTDQALRHVP